MYPLEHFAQVLRNVFTVEAHSLLGLFLYLIFELTSFFLSLREVHTMKMCLWECKLPTQWIRQPQTNGDSHRCN